MLFCSAKVCDSDSPAWEQTKASLAWSVSHGLGKCQTM